MKVNVREKGKRLRCSVVVGEAKSKRKFYAWEYFGHTFGKDVIVRWECLSQRLKIKSQREKTRENGWTWFGQSSTT
jgi:hypothetical protein